MGSLKQTLIKFATASGIATLTAGTALAAEDTPPNLKDLTTGAEALIQGTTAPQDLSGIQYRFRDLANDAKTRAKYLEIQKLLPAIDKDIDAWRVSSWTLKDGEKPLPLPESDNIKTLQRLLGFSGDDVDGALGPKTARALTYLASRPVGSYGNNSLPKLNLETYDYLSRHIQEQAPGNYATYLEKAGETHTKAISGLKTKLDKAGSNATKLTKLAFESCTGEQLALDKDAFVRSIVEALDSKGGKIDAAIEGACKDILDLASPEQRTELLSSLQKKLTPEIKDMQKLITEEKEIRLLEKLLKKYLPKDEAIPETPRHNPHSRFRNFHI